MLTHDAYISLPGRSLVQVDNTALRSITHSFSRASPDGVRGELVHVGAGGDADFAGRDLRGCIVLVDGIATPPVARARIARGRDRAVAHQPARAPARDVHLAGLGQSVRRRRWRTAADRRVQRAAVGRQRRCASGWRAASGRRVTLQAEVDTGWRADADPGGGHGRAETATRRSCCSPAITTPGTTA